MGVTFPEKAKEWPKPLKPLPRLLRKLRLLKQLQMEKLKLKLLPQKTEPQKLHQMEPQRRLQATAQLKRPLMEQLKLSLQTEPLRQNPQRQKLNLQTEPPLKQQKPMELLRLPQAKPKLLTVKPQR